MMYLVKEGHSFKSVVHSTCEQKFYNNNGFNLNLCYHLSLKSSKGGLSDPVSPFAKWGFWENLLHDNILQEWGEAKAINTHDAEVYIWCPVFLQIPSNLLWVSHGLNKSWFNACGVQEMFLFCWHSYRFASHTLQDSWLTHQHKSPLQLRGSVSTESHALPKATAFSSKNNLCYQRYYIWFVRTLQTMLVLLCFYPASPTCFRQKEEETGHQAKGKAQPMLRMSVSVKLPVLPAEGNQWGGWFVIRGNWLKMGLLI